MHEVLYDLETKYFFKQKNSVRFDKVFLELKKNAFCIIPFFTLIHKAGTHLMVKYFPVALLTQCDTLLKKQALSFRSTPVQKELFII